MADHAINLPWRDGTEEAGESRLERLERQHVDLAHQPTYGPGIEFNNVVSLLQERINRAWLRLVAEQR